MNISNIYIAVTNINHEHFTTFITSLGNYFVISFSISCILYTSMLVDQQINVHTSELQVKPLAHSNR